MMATCWFRASRNALLQSPRSVYQGRFYCTQSPNRKKWNVLFFGTDGVSVATLNALRNAQMQEDKLIDNLEVVVGASESSKLSPVKHFAARQGLKMHEVSRTTFRDWQLPTLADGRVVVSFGYFIPARIISAFPNGGINMHPSLLPRHRGAAPIYYTLLKDDKVGGISVIELHKTKFDVGNILYQEQMPIRPDITHNELEADLAELGAKSVMKVLSDFENYSKNAKQQTNDGATKAPKINSDMGKISWKNITAHELWILWRALGDTVGLYTYYQTPRTQIRVKISKLLPPDTPFPPSLPIDAASGTLVPYKMQLWVKCKDTWLCIAALQSDAKRVVPAFDWCNGYKIGKSPTASNSFLDLN